MEFLQSPLLHHPRNLFHAFTTRIGGSSKGAYAENNLAFHVGDIHLDVLKNHNALASFMGYSLNDSVWMQQVHGEGIAVIEHAHTFNSPPECDAMICATPGKALMVMVADCTPVLMYDRKNRVIAAVHAGRKGAMLNIVGKTVQKMRTHFGSDAENLSCVLGPSIKPCCYEVGQDALEVPEYAYALLQRENRFFLDINAILLQQLEREGISKEQTDVMAHCTSCENKRFFSYRADKQVTGRFCGLIMLKGT